MTAFLLKSFTTNVTRCLKDTVNIYKIRNRKDNFCATRRNVKTTNAAFTIRLALPPDYENVVDFMCETYYKNEPVVHNIGMAGTEAPDCWRLLMFKQVRAGLSIIAENQEHCIIGAALNTVTYPWEAKTLRQFAKTCEPSSIRRIVEFFGFVASESNVWEHYCVGHIFEVSSLAVSNEYRGFGIAKRLIGESWYLARDCSHYVFLIVCHSSYCAKICERFGWEMIWSIPFDQYVCDGEVVFKHVKEPHTVCQLYVDQLRKYKPYCQSPKKCDRVTYPPEIN